MRKTTAVSIRASREYVRALNEYAKDQDTTTGDLLRELIDEKLAKQIQIYIDDSAKRVEKSRQLSKELDRA